MWAEAQNWAFTGGSPINLDTMAPVGSNITYTYPVLLNPGADQTITSGNLNLSGGSFRVTVGGGSGVLPTIIGDAIIGDSNVTLGSGTGTAYGIIGTVHAAGDVSGDKAYGGWFRATTANLAVNEVGIHAESKDTTGTAAEFGSNGTVYASFTGTGSLVMQGTATKQISGGPEIISLQSTSASNVGIWAGLATDTDARFLLDISGDLEWGSGTTADQDCMLARNGAGVMALFGGNASIGDKGGNLQFWDCDPANQGQTGHTFPTVYIKGGADGAGVIAFAAPSGSAVDTGLSRISAGLIGVGNGTTGDYSGTMKGIFTALTGSTAPTATPFTNNNSIASTAYVDASLLASDSQTALTANYNSGSAKSIVATPVAGAVYVLSGEQACNRAASSSSTFPALTLGYTDAGGIARTVALVTTSSSNATTLVTNFSVSIHASSAAAIMLTSASYVSSGATTMQYSLGYALKRVA